MSRVDRIKGQVDWIAEWRGYASWYRDECVQLIRKTTPPKDGVEVLCKVAYQLVENQPPKPQRDAATYLAALKAAVSCFPSCARRECANPVVGFDENVNWWCLGHFPTDYQQRPAWLIPEALHVAADLVHEAEES